MKELSDSHLFQDRSPSPVPNDSSQTVSVPSSFMG